jgi:pyridoxal phosphate enzyme (YggS family)
MARAAAASGRSLDAVKLIAVTKTFSAERVMEGVAAGLLDFGENRVQEAMGKYAWPGETHPAADLVPRHGITLHMIGTLQRNKARKAARFFDCIHSVDRAEIVAALDEAAGEGERASPLPVLLEVNLTGEPSKIGALPDHVPWLAEALSAAKHLRGIGLMTIARLGAAEIELRTTFSTLRAMLESLRKTYPGVWTELSMGMSDDYEYAIEEGATMVRLGRAIFGERA